MGYWANSQEAVVTQIIGPGPQAIHTTMSFSPDHDYQVREIARLYDVSGHTETYLGDWHTHPKAEAYLSGRDKKTLKTIAAYKPARLKKPIMLILGTNPLEMKIWLHEYKGVFRWSTILQCKVCMY